MPIEDGSISEQVSETRVEHQLKTRGYVWSYWVFHAEQRLKTFNFFILYVTVLTAGALTYIRDSAHPYFAAPLGALLIAICWLFWRLDCRNRQLIRHAEGILKEIESGIPIQMVPESQRLMCTEAAATEDRRGKIGKLSWNSPLSFYHVFCANFIIFSIFGVILFVVPLIAPSKASTAAGEDAHFIQNQYFAPIFYSSSKPDREPSRPKEITNDRQSD